MYIPTPSKGENIKNFTKDILAGRVWRISEKIDGVRRLFYKDDDGRVTAFSSSGKRDKWLKHIFEYLEQKRFPSNRVYDCELVDKAVYFSDAPSYILRRETSAKASIQSYDNKEDLMAICFDIYTPKLYEPGRIRDAELFRIFSQTPVSEPVIMVPTFGVIFGNDGQVLKNGMNRVRVWGGEGLMLMDMNAPHISGKSNNLIKIKHLEEFIGTIVDIEMAQEDTKIRGGISALICSVDGCTVPVRVGSGFTQEQRKEIADDFTTYIGKEIEIESYNKTKDRKGNVSLSCPIFKRFRYLLG